MEFDHTCMIYSLYLSTGLVYHPPLAIRLHLITESLSDDAVVALSHLPQ